MESKSLFRHSVQLFVDGPWLKRKMQHYRPLICPIERILSHIPQGSSVLDVGCGSGLLLGLLAQLDGEATGVGVDFSSSAISLARLMTKRLLNAERMQFLVLDASCTWPVGQFDVVSVVDVFHHLSSSDQKRVFTEAVEHVKPGGFLIYKDMTGSHFWLALANRCHDLLVSRQWINYISPDTVLSWAGSLPIVLAEHEFTRRYWYGHDLLVFKKVSAKDC
jgi:cyclopropane fatty-acyl-phospholipid synthase-like methyltransferase